MTGTTRTLWGIRKGYVGRPRRARDPVAETPHRAARWNQATSQN
jgi:hypothetical protein